MSALIIFVILNFMAATSGGIFTPDEWYQQLKKPDWIPPDWVFPTVWLVLYMINAFAGWQVWQVAGGDGIGFWAMVIYGVALTLNAGWSAVFFGFKLIRLAIVEASLLWVAIAVQAILFFQIVPWAGLLVLPYLLWVSIAIFLNYTVWRLNPEVSGDHVNASST